MINLSVGSVCSGIEAASVAWGGLGFDFKWFSEISEFPSRLLRLKHPNTPNFGDMCALPEKLLSGQASSPDLICGGTPCQAFSLAGWKKGLEDTRGNLTLKFVDIVDANDIVRSSAGLPPTLVLWENVEGVLRDKTNAFGCLLSSLAGYETALTASKWPQAGVIHGPKRNIAWRVLDAKYFGLAQQRRRLYVVAGGKDFFPEQVLFEPYTKSKLPPPSNAPLTFEKQGHLIEVFRAYTDCVYSAYGTKWNGNAAAYNGSLFVVQNGRLRRLTPLECERLMGFPDNYTNIPDAKPTNRYQGVGNSWAVPVIRWLGERIANHTADGFRVDADSTSLLNSKINLETSCAVFDFSNDRASLTDGQQLNWSERPVNSQYGNLFDVIDVHASENFYITPVGCKGILRRKEERQLSMNLRLETVLQTISSQWSDEKIEAISMIQNRGRFSSSSTTLTTRQTTTPSLFEEAFA
ncbi:MAG: DNA cytosine methyltransferase [Cytophagales bacterium]|nr:DNA cytosine methyltransferase [Cytophagales bacterium]